MEELMTAKYGQNRLNCGLHVFNAKMQLLVMPIFRSHLENTDILKIDEDILRKMDDYIKTRKMSYFFSSSIPPILINSCIFSMSLRMASISDFRF